MAAEIIPIGGYTNLDIEPNNVLEKAIDKLDINLVLGIDKNGEYYFASSTSDKWKLFDLTEQFRRRLINGDFG
jgi:hypothetical protein